jgi:dsDNA-specific endonuclease/ATPase MutS2
MDEVYLERYLNILSGWAENIKVLERSNSNDSIKEIAEKLYPLLELFESNKEKKITRGEIDVYLMEINKKISEEVKGLSVSGESLFNMMSRNVIPKEIKEIIERAIRESNVPNNVFTRTMPVEIDENEIENLIRRQDSAENTSMAKRIKKEADMLRKVPEMLDNLAFQMLIFDFESGISSYLSQANDFPEMSENVIIYESKNVFLENAQAISFNLSEQNKCSILTGANSGGKTTLIEHVIQLYCFFQLGLPTIGRINTPLFTEIYYFAKNKGSINKGAFETLLSQMSEIKAGNKTLILADEIESVTEPGVAGDIISASAEYFIRKGCFLIIATHLGKEIEKNMPIYARIDGIEAKGLDSNFDLIVDHNPVIGRLANSTPELIIEKMANTIQNDYFKHLFDSLKNK